MLACAASQLFWLRREAPQAAALLFSGTNAAEASGARLQILRVITVKNGRPPSRPEARLRERATLLAIAARVAAEQEQHPRQREAGRSSGRLESPQVVLSREFALTTLIRVE
jgi:hypothetical protein